MESIQWVPLFSHISEMDGLCGQHANVASSGGAAPSLFANAPAVDESKKPLATPAGDARTQLWHPRRDASGACVPLAVRL